MDRPKDKAWRAWSKEDLATLESMWIAGDLVAVIAERLGRGKTAVYDMAHRRNLKSRAGGDMTKPLKDRVKKQAPHISQGPKVDPRTLAPDPTPLERAMAILGHRISRRFNGGILLDRRPARTREIIAAANTILIAAGVSAMRYPGVAA